MRFAFLKGEKAIIGLTSNSFVQRVEKEKTESYKTRRANLNQFLRTEGLIDKAKIIQIHDVFGPTLSKELPLEAIIVSKDTVRGAELINKKRKEKGLPALKVFIAPSVLAEDGDLISSSRIRNGEINREGRLYVQPQWLRHSLFLPEKLRSVLRKPFGRVIKSVKELNSVRDFAQVITVGDIVTREFNCLGIGQKISVVDFKVARQKMFKSLSELGFEGKEEVLEVKNPSGSLTPELFKAVQKAMQLVNSKQQIRFVLKVDGEEDLAVLPILLSFPLGWTIFYGQPEEGVVEVKVTQESKKRAYELVDRFSPRSAYY